MAREYILRHHSNGNYKGIHPKIDEILRETYGVMVYQEDVIKVAHLFAGLTLAEADTLRRAMAWKFRVDDGFKIIEDKYYASCKKMGILMKWHRKYGGQMEGFRGFSFCKAHSASYAVESYQSLFLKAYYPLEFMVAVINNFGGYYNTEFYVNEARRAGAGYIRPVPTAASILPLSMVLIFILVLSMLKALKMTFPKALQSKGSNMAIISDLKIFANGSNRVWNNFLSL